jgi:hypothetical protein
MDDPFEGWTKAGTATMTTGLAAAYAMLLADVVVSVLALTPMAWARQRRHLYWIYGLFVCLHASAILGVGGFLLAAGGRLAETLVVLVYGGPALVAASCRLVYEWLRWRGERR